MYLTVPPSVLCCLIYTKRISLFWHKTVDFCCKVLYLRSTFFIMKFYLRLCGLYVGQTSWTFDEFYIMLGWTSYLMAFIDLTVYTVYSIYIHTCVSVFSLCLSLGVLYGVICWYLLGRGHCRQRSIYGCCEFIATKHASERLLNEFSWKVRMTEWVKFIAETICDYFVIVRIVVGN